MFQLRNYLKKGKIPIPIPFSNLGFISFWLQPILKGTAERVLHAKTNLFNTICRGNTIYAWHWIYRSTLYMCVACLNTYRKGPKKLESKLFLNPCNKWGSSLWFNVCLQMFPSWKCRERMCIWTERWGEIFSLYRGVCEWTLYIVSFSSWKLSNHFFLGIFLTSLMFVIIFLFLTHFVLKYFSVVSTFCLWIL